MRRGDESLFPFHCIRRSSSLGYHKCASVLACAGSKLSFFVATFARCPQGVTDDWEKCAMRTRAAVWSTALWKLRRTLGARPATLRALVERAKARLHRRPLMAVRIRGFNNTPRLNLNVGGCIARLPMHDGNRAMRAYFRSTAADVRARWAITSARPSSLSQIRSLAFSLPPLLDAHKE